MDEYITMLIRKDNAELQAQLTEQGRSKCGKCGGALPGEGVCWQTMGWHETKLSL